MMEEPKKTVVICKRDILPRFWKITLEPGQVYPTEEFLIKFMRFLHRNVNYQEFTLYSDSAYFEVWNKDEYREIDFTNILNVQGRHFPKGFQQVTLFPMANIRTSADIIKYNRWRKTTFKAYIRELQNGYVWKRSDGVHLLSSYYAGWLKINPDTDIHTINPPELLDCLNGTIKTYLKKKLTFGDYNGIQKDL